MLRYKDGNLKLVWKFILLFLTFDVVFSLWIFIFQIFYPLNSIYSDYLNTISQNIITILIVFMFLIQIDEKNLDDIGIRYNQNVIKHFALGMLLATCTLILIIGLSMLSGFSYFIGFGVENFTTNSIITNLFLGLLLCLCIGFGEEILSRGYIQTNISSKYGKFVGLIVASVIFMCLHIGTYSKLLDFLDMLTAGLLLGYMYLITDSLYLSIGYHFFTDYLQIFLFRFEKGIISSSPIFIFNLPENLYIGSYNLGCKAEIYFIVINLLALLFLYILNKFFNFRIMTKR